MNEFVWVGGRPALDLCNTIVGGRDLFATPTDIYEWLQEAGFPEPADAPCSQNLQRVRALRDALRRAFVTHDAVDVADVVAEWFSAAPGHLAVDRESLQARFCPDTQSCECMFVPTLLDAIELARDDIARVRLCAADACSMIYLDASRNGSRRWCSMERCGARAKAHAYYERKRGRA